MGKIGLSLLYFFIGYVVITWMGAYKTPIIIDI